MTEMAVFYHNDKGVESHSLQIDLFWTLLVALAPSRANIFTSQRVL